MKYIEIRRASNGWIVEFTQYQGRGPCLTLFTNIEEAMKYLKEIMSNN